MCIDAMLLPRSTTIYGQRSQPQFAAYRVLPAEKPITLIKQYPLQYDLSREDYTNYKNKDKIWDNTGKELNEDEMTSPLVHEKIWLEKFKYDEAERQYFEKLSKGSSNSPLKSSLAGEVAKARQHIKNSLECMDGIAALATNVNVELVNRLNSLEKSNTELNSLVKDLQAVIKQLDSRVKVLETNSNKPSSTTSAAPSTKAPTQKTTVEDNDNDDGVDLFGSDSEEESEEAKKIKEQRLAEYAAKKSKKPALIAKSNIILDVKPWDDETDMKLMEAEVRKISMDGLLWGASKLVPLAFGIHKLQISCVVEDDKVSVDVLQEAIEAIEDYVQSVDIAAFNKV